MFTEHVLKNLLLYVSDARDLLSLSAVCVRWYFAAMRKRGEHWERLCRARWPVMDWEAARSKRPTLDWYVRYRLLADRELWYLNALCTPPTHYDRKHGGDRVARLSVLTGFLLGLESWGRAQAAWCLFLVGSSWPSVCIGFDHSKQSLCWRPWVQCCIEDGQRHRAKLTDRECAMFMACGKRCNVEASITWADAAKGRLTQ